MKKLILPLMGCVLLASCQKQTTSPFETQMPTKSPSSTTSMPSTENTSTASLTTSSSAAVIPVSAKEQKTASVQSWRLSGAIAARTNKKSFSAAIQWAQRGAGQYNIRMSGPLGSGTVIIEKNGSNIVLKDGNKVIQSKDANTLFAKQTGINLPVGYLFYWVRGLEAPGGASSKNASGGRLTSLQQHGYSIQYERYTKVNNAVLPSVIKLQGRGIFVKLVVKQWAIA